VAAASRYHKQMLFPGIGSDGQQHLSQSRILLVGCGALGCAVADSLVRAGVGHIRIVDRDFVELTNLQRQVLFDERDAEEQLPKVIAAQRRLNSVNSSVIVEPIIADVDHTNLAEFANGVSLILDGTDNFEIRYLLNDYSLDSGIPWIFAGCTGSAGQVMPVFPGESACLRCLMSSPPPPGTTETCDTAGVLGPAIQFVTAIQSTIAMKILTGRSSEVERRLHILDVWAGTLRSIDLSGLRSSGNCPACHQGERLWLSGSQRSSSTVLCGRNAVQITPPEKLQRPLTELAERLQASGKVSLNAFLLRVTIPVESTMLNPLTGHPDLVSEPSAMTAPSLTSDAPATIEMTVFPDGRAIIRGTSDPVAARTLYARYIGS
jgi:molybdopterin/thiamine biosynthesis adenylyltransferase